MQTDRWQVDGTGRQRARGRGRNNTIEAHFNSDGVLKEYYWSSGSGWSGLVTVGGAITNTPRPRITRAPEAPDVHFNSGGTLYENYHTAGGWSGAVSVGGTIS
jgi:hypothetical protein